MIASDIARLEKELEETRLRHNCLIANGLAFQAKSVSRVYDAIERRLKELKAKEPNEQPARQYPCRSCGCPGH